MVTILMYMCNVSSRARALSLLNFHPQFVYASSEALSDGFRGSSGGLPPYLNFYANEIRPSETKLLHLHGILKKNDVKSEK